METTNNCFFDNGLFERWKNDWTNKKIIDVNTSKQKEKIIFFCGNRSM